MPESPDLSDLKVRATTISSDLAGPDENRIIEIADRTIGIISRAMVHSRYNAIPDEVVHLGREFPDLARLVVARLISRADGDTVSTWPETVRLELVRQGHRILAHCENASNPMGFDDDIVQKDIGIARLALYPCRAQVVERSSGVSLRLLLSKDLASACSLGVALALQGGRRPYYEIHTHTPMLDGFDLAGWTACFEMVADLMVNDRGILGVIGISWFYDPAIEAISPRLAYLRTLPIAGGALFLRSQSTERDAALATATSATRRALYESGQYVPTSFAMIWQRKGLLQWRHRTG